MHDDGWDGMDDAISWSLLARGLHTYGARGGDSGTHFPDWFDKADRFLSFLPSSLRPPPASTSGLHAQRKARERGLLTISFRPSGVFWWTVNGL